jgi:hypothetical protein
VGPGGDVTLVEPGDPGAGDVTLTIRADKDVKAISRLIYGVNGTGQLNGGQAGAGLVRFGGNRLTAYNWENNASNAGEDYQNQNDNFLTWINNIQNEDKPGEVARELTQRAFDAGASMLLTIPICGYVAADKNGGGDVNQTPNYLSVRFNQTVAQKGAPFSVTPDVNDDFVYQDEFVAFLSQTFPEAFKPGSGPQILFSLDNEPDLWSSTHPRIHPDPVGYQELVDKNISFAKAIKAVAPEALITGFVSYGYNGYVTLQNAPDSGGKGEFVDFWLAKMKEAEAAEGKRLVDVMDLHWYPEVYANGQRITGTDTSDASVEARVQAPRSLWDAAYKEDSWIANDVIGGPIALLPWLQKKIDDNYPGTKLGFTEYYYGGGNHISGAIAQADVLGVFGREGVFLANLWELSDQTEMINAGMRAFTSYDGAGARFGDVSVQAQTSDVERATVYASFDEANPSRTVIVAINKSAGPLTAAVSMAAYGNYKSVDVFQLTSAKADLVQAAAVTPSATNAFLYEMPALSVSVLVPQQ